MKIKEKLIMPCEQAAECIWEEMPEGIKFVQAESLGDDYKRRWAETCQLVVQRELDGKYFSAFFQRGLTENCDISDQDMFEVKDGMVSFVEVFKTERKIIVYE